MFNPPPPLAQPPPPGRFLADQRRTPHASESYNMRASPCRSSGGGCMGAEPSWKPRSRERAVRGRGFGTGHQGALKWWFVVIGGLGIGTLKLVVCWNPWLWFLDGKPLLHHQTTNPNQELSRGNGVWLQRDPCGGGPS